MKIDITEIMRLKSLLASITSEMESILSGVNSELENIASNIKSSKLQASVANLEENIQNLSTLVVKDMNNLENFIETQMNDYEGANEEAKTALERIVSLIQQTFDADGNIVLTASTTISSTSFINNVAPDISIYTSKPEKGFTVTTGNQTYELSDDDRRFVYSVVAAEAINDYDDALGVVSVVLNRCEAPEWSMDNNSPVAQLKRTKQFSAYNGGNGPYKAYYNGTTEIPDKIKTAVDDALNGVRNCEYLYFNASYVKGYNGKQIVQGGNQYK